MIRRFSSKIKLWFFLRSLKSVGEMPSAVEIGHLGPYLVVNILDQDNPSNDFLAGNVSTGMSLIAEISWLKALSEWIERKAFLENKAKDPARFIRESDGCASYPHVLVGKSAACKIARTKALDEAVERFVWGRWWDGKLAAEIKVLNPNSSYLRILEALGDSKLVPETLFIITPKFDKFNDRKVIVLFLLLSGGGFVSGGACGYKDEIEDTFERAFSELLRHFVGYGRMRNSKLKPTSFYDRRLHFFASGMGDSVVWERLESKNESIVNISSIEFDSILEHKLKNISTVYHVQFENPPFFLEGPLERLCI